MIDGGDGMKQLYDAGALVALDESFVFSPDEPPSVDAAPFVPVVLVFPPPHPVSIDAAFAITSNTDTAFLRFIFSPPS